MTALPEKLSDEQNREIAFQFIRDHISSDGRHVPRIISAFVPLKISAALKDCIAAKQYFSVYTIGGMMGWGEITLWRETHKRRPITTFMFNGIICHERSDIDSVQFQYDTVGLLQ